MKLKNVLLASHGTDGAKAAERMAFDICEKGTKLHHLVVVDTLWQGMTGDDWLNNGGMRDKFRRYLENELGQEIDAHMPSSLAMRSICASLPARKALPWQPYMPRIPLFVNTRYPLYRTFGSR